MRRRGRLRSLAHFRLDLLWLIAWFLRIGQFPLVGMHDHGLDSFTGLGICWMSNIDKAAIAIRQFQMTSRGKLRTALGTKF